MANEVARALRKRMTPQEVKLWSRLRRFQARGFHFRRQVPIDGYILDFACLRARLIIEVDGSQHADEPHAPRDAERDAYFVRSGFTLLRFWNNDIDRRLDAVLASIQAALESNDPPPRLRQTAEPTLLALGEGGRKR